MYPSILEHVSKLEQWVLRRLDAQLTTNQIYYTRKIAIMI